METKEINQLLNSLAPIEKKVYDKIVELFTKRVEVEQGLKRTEYYYKWFLTICIAEELNLKVSDIRKVLNHLEKSGFVHSKRRANHILWAANFIEGFKQHQFHDYYYQLK